MESKTADNKNVDHHQNAQATQQPARPSKNRPAPRKQGMDRRLKVKDAAFKEQMNKKMRGQDVPKTLRVSSNCFTDVFCFRKRRLRCLLAHLCWACSFS